MAVEAEDLRTPGIATDRDTLADRHRAEVTMNGVTVPKEEAGTIRTTITIEGHTLSTAVEDQAVRAMAIMVLTTMTIILGIITPLEATHRNLRILMGIGTAEGRSHTLM